MDAHLFRLFANAALPLLENARIEKIQGPFPNLLALGLYANYKKRQLYFRFGRQNPFCFFSDARVPAATAPSAQIMRLRRYFAQKRISSAVFQIPDRKLWLLADGQKNGLAAWLCLDLAHGASLHFLEADETPEAADILLPEREDLESALENWQTWPALTPPLRKTMRELDKPDQLALLEDLRQGNGNIFLYGASGLAEQTVEQALAWPLPAALRGELAEECQADIIAALEKAGKYLVFEKLFAALETSRQAPLRKRTRQLEKILAKMDQDERRYRDVAALEDDALALKANLWRWPKEFGAESVSVDGRCIPLDRRYTVRQNMDRIFHRVRRAKRGLVMLAERRANVLAELESLKTADGIQVESGSSGQPDAPRQAERARALQNILPKNVQGFISSDGYAILRGKDAAGNRAMRRLAQAHDLWVHVENGPGAHVIIRIPHPGHEIAENTLIEAGTLAACKSWQANAASATVMFAQLRHVKPMRNSPDGMVKIDRMQFTRTVPVDHDLEKKLGRNTG